MGDLENGRFTFETGAGLSAAAPLKTDIDRLLRISPLRDGAILMLFLGLSLILSYCELWKLTTP